MKMRLKGSIELVKEAVVRGEHCLGTTEAKGSWFRIRIADVTTHRGELFCETTLHELIHLWLYIVTAATGTELTEKEHHKIIDVVVPNAMKALKRVYDRNNH
jgi:hypothetical protein